MQPVEYQPPLTRWSHAWRLILVLAVSALAWWELAPWQLENSPWWFAVDVVLGLASLGLVFWRRAHPVAVAAVVNALTAVSASAGGPATLALMSLATRRRWREIIPVGVLTVVAGTVLEAMNPVSTEALGLTVPFILVIVATTIGWGMFLGSRRELLATLRARAETAESDQAVRVAQARTFERTRIAREMHDVLAHRISLVTMHAGALSYRDDLAPDQVRRTADVIQENSHQAMVELREVLGILREDPGDAAPELPQPSASDLPALVEEARSAGMRVQMRSNVSLDLLPDTLGRTLYRVVQEGLTNVRKHAPETVVSVDLDGSENRGLRVHVLNPLPIGDRRGATESGLGLIGLIERAELIGGRLEHRITPEREFVLEAWLPWPT
ncbi:sensor histidine kinase [Aeromicrobium sp. CF3.5]|uniref:sensor histidine kinase n=1 Tax=Aeromicrobium sp. CF3.5 TaxID=3373078 RepID=UPI003EE643DA